jgi:probable rRNA maturation factor
MIHLRINPALKSEIPNEKLKHAAQLVLLHQNISLDAELTIVLTSDQEVQELNRAYRAVDAPTDVLAFASGHENPETGALYLGDVIISYPRALDQAKGHTLLQELELLIIHGTLHLLGYDHVEESHKTRMWHVQNEILRQLDNPCKPQ